MLWFFLSSLPLFLHVVAVQLPGRCPKVPVTQPMDLKVITGPFHLALGKGFSDHPSYLFQNKSHQVNTILDVWLYAENNRGCIDVVESQEIHTYGRVHSCSEGPLGDTLIMVSVITNPDDVVCSNEVIVDHVYLWYEDNVLILWSCKEILQTKSHDEAILIIGTLGSPHGNPNKYPSSDRIRATVSKYNMDKLFTEDEWLHLDPNAILKPEDGLELFPCLKEGNYLQLVAMAILLLGGALLGFKLRPRLGEVPLSNNRVNPSTGGVH